MKPTYYIMQGALVLALSNCADTPVSKVPLSETVFPIDFRVNTSYLLGMTTSSAPGLAPSSVAGKKWEFTCTRANIPWDCRPQNEESSPDLVGDDVKEFCLDFEFSSNKYVGKALKVYYYKTGANTATILYWFAAVEPTGFVYGDSMYEVRLTFTDATSGFAHFATCGHGYDYYGCGTFTLRP